ncbi:uncharacterized protein LOC115099297 isoform X3 [Rhinatrema bivittatum]|uniref:uncharacterized protein LOC115099297 isoform X3 n=1 Tax=Rhinatrema bivittatum TaxID=194408 RepID=UPI0011266FD3|nr:uncharacterized protein LOC115099297 isoform X3 [Rhinatrema bivittatum]
MDTGGKENSSTSGALCNEKIYTLAYIYVSVSSLSLIGSGSVIIASVARKRCFADQVRALFLLSLADFLAAAVLVSTGIIQLLPAPLFILVYEICPYGLLLAMAGNITKQRAKLYLAYGLAWLVPLLLFLVQLITRGWSMKDVVPLHMGTPQPQKRNQSEGRYSLFCSRCIVLVHKSEDFCYEYMDNEHVVLYEKIAFFMYLLLVFTCCTFLYCRVKRWCQRHEATPRLSRENGDFASGNIRSARKTARLIQLVFLVCWTPAFLLSVLSFTSVSASSVYGLFIIQASTISLQGFLNSLAYGWLRQNFRQEAIGERMPLSYSPPKAFYDESLTLIQ